MIEAKVNLLFDVSVCSLFVFWSITVWAHWGHPSSINSETWLTHCNWFLSFVHCSSVSFYTVLQSDNAL